MNIQILTHLNGVGLERDARIIEKLLIENGHSVTVTCLLKGRNTKYFDLNLHLELVGHHQFAYAKKNVLIPNPEWFPHGWIKELPRFNKVFAKTRDCEKLFSQYHKSVVYTAFTSIDQYLPEVEKTAEYALHVAGKSQTKGTNELLKAYQQNGVKLPRLIIVSQNYKQETVNVLYQYKLSEEDLKTLQNTCLIHVCTSQYEGWGHYLWEAMSSGAVVITTDNAPMNEFITDGETGFLVKTKGNIHHGVAQMGIIDENDLQRVVEMVKDTPEKVLYQIGQNAREKYLKNDTEFKINFINQINSI